MVGELPGYLPRMPILTPAPDVLGVVTEVKPLDTINVKSTQKTLSKRDITLADKSGSSVRLTIWGKQAETFQAENNPVIAFKGVRVGDFGGV